MRNLFLVLILSCAFLSCKKEVEGLSPETGNLEINVDALSIVDNYEVYMEQQYYLLRSGQRAVPIFDGGVSKNRPATVKALQKGYYGIRVFGNGQSWQKPFSIIPNQVNKITFP